MAASPDLRAAREQVVRDHMRSENEQHFDETIATFSHPRYELVPTGAVYDGEDDVRAYYVASRTVVPDQRNELIALHHTDDGVIVEFWLRGTQLGTPDGTPPSGRAFECRMIALFLFDGERIVCERVYWDQQTISRQLRDHTEQRA
jgi:steroid delta-isomerase-like uncharacterized protein